MYVDLIENPERFTGYAGPSANKVWQSIYQENCFRDEAAERQSISAIWNKCVERQAFYRVVSGLHASISVHLSDKFYNLRLKSWVCASPTCTDGWSPSHPTPACACRRATLIFFTSGLASTRIACATCTTSTCCCSRLSRGSLPGY